MKTEQEQIKELREIRCELIMALWMMLYQPSAECFNYALKVYDKAKAMEAMEASEVEKLVPVILEKSLNIYVDRDSRKMGGNVVQIIIENQSIVPDQKAYSLAYDCVCECFDDIRSCGTGGYTRYISSAGVRITFYQSGTTIRTTVRDIKPNE